MPFFDTADGLKLYYEDHGQGVPILCLSGLTRDSRDFSYVLPHLAGNRVILMDYRGRGKSDFSPDYKTYSIPQEAHDALALMDHLGLEKAAILGTSRGGLIALVLAVTAKDRLLGVALNDIGPELDPKGLEVISGYLGRPPIWKTYSEAAAARPSVMAGFANVPQDRWNEEVRKFFVETDTGLELTYDPKLRDAVLETGAEGAPDLWPFFDAFQGLPIAAIRGENSDLLSPATLDEMERRRPDMISATIPDRGHVPFLDEPESISALTKWTLTLT